MLTAFDAGRSWLPGQGDGRSRDRDLEAAVWKALENSERNKHVMFCVFSTTNIYTSKTDFSLISNRRTKHVPGLVPPQVLKPLVLLAASWSKLFDFLVSNIFHSVSCIFPFSSDVFLIAIFGFQWQHRFQASQGVHR